MVKLLEKFKEITVQVNFHKICLYNFFWIVLNYILLSFCAQGEGFNCHFLLFMV